MNLALVLLVSVAFGLVGAALGGVGRWSIRAVVRCPPPWCELACAGVSALVGWRAATGALPLWWAPVPLVLGWFAVPLVAADLTTRRLPDRLTLSAYPIIGGLVGLAAAFDPGLGPRALVGAALFGGAHLLVRLLAPRSLGGGDVKLAGSLGGVLAAVGWPAVAFAATFAAAVTVVLALGCRTRSAPHGPGLLAATLLVAVCPGGLLPTV